MIAITCLQNNYAMASANNCVLSCSLCDVFLLPSERREVFSYSSEFVLPLLKQVVADVFGKADKLPDVFLLGSKLCGPRYRRLEAIDFLKRGPLPEKIEGPGQQTVA